MKKLLCACLSALMLATCVFGGCAMGRDGRDGQDLNIYDIYEAANAAREEQGQSPLEFLDFLEEYLSQINVSYSDETHLQAIINRALLSSVAIVSEFTYQPYGVSSSKSAFFSGSGVIVEMDKSAGDAYILTNCHVVYDDITDGEVSGIRDDFMVNPAYAKNVYIYPYGKDSDFTTPGAVAQIVASSASYDLALLKLTGSNTIKNGDLHAAEFTDSEEVYVGAPVFAVGNPEACGLSATRGIISRDSEKLSLSIYGEEEHDFRVIRTDTAINGGNSGGGLFDFSGKLAGIVSSKLVGDEIDNMGYALPASCVKRLWKLFKDGYGSVGSPMVRRAYFPEEYMQIESVAAYDNSDNITKITDTVIVAENYNGLQRGDMILGVKIYSGDTLKDEIAVNRYFNINDVLLSAREGDAIVYEILRGDSRQEIRTAPIFSAVI